LRLTIDGATSNNFSLFIGDASTVWVTGITVSGAGGATTISTNGGSLQMIANVTPSNATNKDVYWEITSGAGIATINSTGVLTAVSNGTVTVRATAKDGTAVFGERVITINGQSGLFMPVISGPTTWSLFSNYTATSVRFIVSGNPTPTVVLTSGDSHFSWNSLTNSLEIAPGLAIGTYVATIEASNSQGTDVLTFRLTVERPVYFIEIGTFVGGRVTSVSHAPYLGWIDETITLNISPDAGYDFETIHVYSMYNRNIEIPLSGSGLTRTFKMPAHHVTVVAAFRDPRGVGIEEVQTIGLTAYTEDGTLFVSGLTAGKPWSVYDITGNLVYQGIADGTKAQLALPGRGIYIVNDGKKSVKVSN